MYICGGVDREGGSEEEGIAVGRGDPPFLWESFTFRLELLIRMR